MSTLEYGRGAFRDEDYQPEPQRAEENQSLQDDATGSKALEDAADDRRQTQEALATLFPDGELPGSRLELHQRLEEAWTSFDQSGDRENPEAGRNFKLAAVYSLTDTTVTDPAEEGPLAYQADGPATYRDRNRPAEDHTEASHQRFLHYAVTGTAAWNPTDAASAVEGVHHLPRIRNMLEANERHITGFTATSLTNPPPEEHTVSWTRSTEENTEALHQMTSGFTNNAPLDAMLTFQLDSLQSSRQALAEMLNQARQDEVGMLHHTAHSALYEYRDDRNRLGDALAAIQDALPGQDTTYLQQEAAEILSHMDFTYALADHATLQAQFEMEELLQQALLHPTPQGRLARVIIAHRGA